MGLLTGKTALITGAARGIGKAIALKFAEEGANIAFTDLVIDENGEATKKEIEAKGVKCQAYASNAANFEETAEVVGKVHADFGSIDILVNNAGITKDGLMMRMTEAQWDAVIAVNLKSAFNFIHACTPIMMRQRSGSIINMASVVGVHGNAGQSNYAASKAGLIALAKSVAQEMGSRGIRAGRFERTVAERVGDEALRLRGLQLFLRDDLLQLLLFLLLHITLPVAVNIRCGVDGVDKAVDQVLFAAQLDAALLNRICCYNNFFNICIYTR